MNPPNRLTLWSPSQRRGLLVLLCVFWIVLLVRWAYRPAFIPENSEAPAARAAELADRVDPNVADWQTLAAIPELGEKRAQAIVAYRERFAASHPAGTRAFLAAHDLIRVKGIGAATAANLEPFLTFDFHHEDTNKTRDQLGPMNPSSSCLRG